MLWSFDGRLFFPFSFVAESNSMTLPTTPQVVLLPAASQTGVFELAARAPFFRVGTTLNDANALTASLTIRATPRLR